MFCRRNDLCMEGWFHRKLSNRNKNEKKIKWMRNPTVFVESIKRAGFYTLGIYCEREQKIKTSWLRISHLRGWGVNTQMHGLKISNEVRLKENMIKAFHNHFQIHRLVDQKKPVRILTGSQKVSSRNLAVHLSQGDFTDILKNVSSKWAT